MSGGLCVSREVGTSRWVCLWGGEGIGYVRGDTTEYSQQAGGMHPTGMLSGFLYFYSNPKRVHQASSSELWILKYFPRITFVKLSQLLTFVITMKGQVMK